MTEPEPEIDIRNNPESRAGERDSTQSVARASDGGPPPHGLREADESDAPQTDGTRGDDPLAGVRMEQETDPVTPDTGPDELGGRGPAPRG